MRLSKQAIAALRTIYREEYGDELTEAEAEEMGTRLVELFGLLTRRLPSEGGSSEAHTVRAAGQVLLTAHTLSVYPEGTMRGGETTMYRRINVTLPEGTVRLLERVAPKGERSRLVDEAIRGFVEKVGREKLRKQLREGALRRANRDLALTREWFAFDEEVWQRGDR